VTLPGLVWNEVSCFNVQELKNEYVDRQNGKRALFLKLLAQTLVVGNILTKMNDLLASLLSCKGSPQLQVCSITFITWCSNDWIVLNKWSQYVTSGACFLLWLTSRCVDMWIGVTFYRHSLWLVYIHLPYRQVYGAFYEDYICMVEKKHRFGHGNNASNNKHL